VWDGNEVWLVTGGGALFAAFPEVYATVFSGFYLAFMLLLLALIFRAVSIEFRSKHPSPAWRQAWDVSFSLGSLVAALLIGVALGNIAWGIPLDARHEFAGSFFGLLHPYALLIGAFVVALFLMHGALYLVLKTEGELQQRVRRWVQPTFIAFALLYVLSTAATLLWLPQLTERYRDNPALWVLPALNVLAIASILREARAGRDLRAFLSSGATMVLLMLVFGLGLYPNLVLSNPEPANSLTAYNAASSSATLTNMLIIALIGMPLVLAYTTSIYWIFRGKVKLGQDSY
jgi:cytochrome d ubiquinol oxidase subunit II